MSMDMALLSCAARGTSMGEARSSAMSIDVALSTRRGVGRDTYSLPQKRGYAASGTSMDMPLLNCAPGAMSMDMALLSCTASGTSMCEAA